MDRPIYAPNKGQPIRTSKFSLSSLKAIIRRKTKDDNAVVNKNPYPAQSRRDSKPFMSQPVLALSNPAQSLDIDADDVSDQSAPSDHSSLTINRYPPPQPHILDRPRKVFAQSNVSNSSFNGFLIHDSLVKTQPNSNGGGGTATIYPTLPANIKTSEDSLSNSPQSRGLYKPLPKAIETPPTPASDRLPPIPTISSWSSSSSDDTVGPNTPKVNKLYTSANSSPLIMYSSTPALPSESSPATSDSINSSDKTSHNPPALPVLGDSSSTFLDASKRARVGPKLTVNTMLDVNNNTNNAGLNSSINTTSSQRPILPPIQPRRTVSGAPRLSLPPANYRFSLNLVDGYSARLSPSVILRPPPLPLLNLPVLSGGTSTVGADDASSRRSRRAGLMSMPALPRQGSSRGTAGHEEFDDVAEGDDDDDEDDADGDGDGDGIGEDDDGDGDDTSLDSAPLEDEMDTPRSGYGSSAPETILSSRSRSCTPSLTPSYETAHAKPSKPHEGYLGDLPTPPEKKISRTSFLPPVDMSRIDLSFLNSPPSSDDKGKGKSKELTEDAGRTPIAVVRPNRNRGPATSSTPIAFIPMDFLIPEEAATSTWATSPVLTKDGQGFSPTQTPRAGGHFDFPLPLPVPIPPSPPSPPSSPSHHPVLPTRSTDNRMSMNTMTLFPGTYKRASRSLVDVNALEKKEKVEQMVREEEEGAEEERKRRVKAMRMSMRFMSEGANAITTPPDQRSNGDDNEDGQSKTSLHPDVPRRVSDLAPNWVDGEDDLIKASQGGEASRLSVKQPKKTDNRISMAPAYDTIIPLRRRLSMPTFNSTSTSPPPYPDLFPGQTSYGIKLAQIQPRDDEGKEKLPTYSNSIYLKAIMPRKLEFSRPGVQAKDRKWKRVLCVLEGTSLKVYKPPGVSVISGWWENRVGTGDMAVPDTTTSSFNSANGREHVAVGAVNTIEEGKEEMERERERMRTSSLSQTTPSNPTTSRSRHPSSATTNSSGSGNTPYTSTGLPATKSALNLAVHLLKPSSRGHARTTSDVGQSSNTAHQSPRSSLNIPRNGRSTTPTPTIASTTTGTSVSSSRSPSPMFASSSSLLTTSVTSSSSHRSTDSTSSSIGGGGGSATSRRFNNSSSNRTAAPATSPSTSKGKKKMEDSDPQPHPHNLIKAYTMQQAECGLGTDYLKRKHVIRVRLEGEQFLLQAKDVDNVIEWIEGLQAATNVAMDLDERPMPRGPLFPRRRRRRRVIVSTTINTAGIPHHTARRASPTGNTPVDALQLAPPLV